MRNLSEIAEFLRKRGGKNVDEEQALAMGVGPSAATSPVVSQPASGAPQVTAPGQVEESALERLLKGMVAEPAGDDERTRDRKEMQGAVVQGLMTLAPTLIGGMAGGWQGAASGAQAGTSGVKSMAEEAAKKREAEAKRRAEMRQIASKIGLEFAKDKELIPLKSAYEKDKAISSIVAQNAGKLDALGVEAITKQILKEMDIKADSQKQEKDIALKQSEGDKNRETTKTVATGHDQTAVKTATIGADSRKDVAKIGADARAKRGTDLPPEAKELVKDLAKKNASKLAIANQIDAVIKTFDDESVPEDQKIAQGQQLLKTLNSTEGADAIGAEESKRLGGLLEYKILNFTQPGSTFGRDLKAFRDQAALSSNAIKNAVKANSALIEQAKSGQPIQTQQTEINEKARPNPQPNAAATVDPTIQKYSEMHKLPYAQAEAILRARGYGKK